MTAGSGPDILVYPPALSVAAPVVAIGLEWVFPVAWLPSPGHPATTVSGIGLLAAAGWLAVSGERAFRRAGTNVDPRDAALCLVRDGPYRFTRNPMYLGMVLLQLGLAFAFSLDWALLGAVVVWAVLHFGVVLREEAYLTERFGDAYGHFMNSTRRWL